MAFKSVLFFIVTTGFCTIGNVVCAQFDTILVDDLDIGNYHFPAGPRHTRDLYDSEYFGRESPAGYLGLWDDFVSGRRGMDFIKTDMFLPLHPQNYLPEDAPPLFMKSERPHPRSDGNANVGEKETRQLASGRSEPVLPEDGIMLQSSTPAYVLQQNSNQMDWKKGGDDRIDLNAGSDILHENIDTNFNEEIFNVNQLQTDVLPPADSIQRCYSRCFERCHGAGTTPPRPYCESSRHAKPLVININSECYTQPSQRFSHRYNSVPKSSGKGLLGGPRKFREYSSFPFSDMPPYYY